MSRQWVVIAHRSGARIFLRHGASMQLEPVATLSHAAGHLQEREFNSDRPGRTHDSAGPGRHAMGAENTAREHSAEQFASEISERLEAGRTAHAYAQLVLVAEPHMLGVLRAALSKQCTALVSASVTKDLVHVPDDELMSHLASEL